MADVGGLGGKAMSFTLENVAAKYLAVKKLSAGTQTVAKWTAWGKSIDVDQIERRHIREFLD
jgi:hypothetical protein